MANPQKENGHTRIANELFEKIYQSSFTLRELKIIFAVIRYTYGFSRKEANLSLRFLEQATNISLRHVTSTIKKLVDKNVLIIKNDFWGTRPRKIQLNKNYESWNLSIDQKSNTKPDISVTDLVNGSVTDLVNGRDDQKSNQERKHIKKTIKKDINFLLPNELKEIEGFSEIWKDWTRFRKEIKNPVAPTAAKLQFNKLIKWKDEGFDVIEIINTAIERGYKGFFKPSENKSSFHNNGHKGAHLDKF